MSQQEIKFTEPQTPTTPFKDLQVGDWFMPHDPIHELVDTRFVLLLKVGITSAMRFNQDHKNYLFGVAADCLCVPCRPTITVAKA